MKKINLTKTVGIITIITTIITIISVVLNFLVPIYLSYKLNIDARNTSSIGIIGSADGPTSIYVARQSSSKVITIIFALISIIGIGYQIFSKKSVK